MGKSKDQFHNQGKFLVNEEGTLEFSGNVVTIHNEFRYLTKEQKEDILETLIDWCVEQLVYLKGTK
jgi:hypothetical protein